MGGIWSVMSRRTTGKLARRQFSPTGVPLRIGAVAAPLEEAHASYCQNRCIPECLLAPEQLRQGRWLFRPDDGGCRLLVTRAPLGAPSGHGGLWGGRWCLLGLFLGLQAEALTVEERGFTTTLAFGQGRAYFGSRRGVGQRPGGQTELRAKPIAAFP